MGSAWIFPELSANSDEGIYLLQADGLREGHLTLPAPAQDAEAFVPWFSATEDGEFILKYTPVHATVIATGSALGSPRLALGAIAAAQVMAVAFLARVLRLDRAAVAMAAVLLASAPLVLQLSITYLSYGTSLALALFTAGFAIRADRHRSQVDAVLAGLLWGVALFARPYDAVLWALAIAIGLGIEHRHHGAWREPVRLLPAAVLGAVVPIVAFLAFNAAVTGSVWQLPFNLLEPMDRLGFGPRRALPSDPTIDFTVARGFAALGRNSLLVIGWGGGGLLGIGLGLRHLISRGTGTPFLAALLLVWPVGYLFFWGSYLTVFIWDGGLFLGPYYYLPMVAGFAIAGGAGLAGLRQHDGRLWAGAIAMAAVLTLMIAVPRISEQRDRSTQRVTLADAVEAAVDEVDGDTLVFLPAIYGGYLQNPWSFLRNTPSIDGPVVFALDGGPARNARIADRYPDRWVLELDVPSWSDQPDFTPSITIATVREPFDAE